MTTIRSLGRARHKGPQPRLCIINYGMGNLNSVRNALAFLGYAAAITSDVDEVAAADAYILPGVGAFGQAMANLRSSGLADVLGREVLDRGKPFLGICLGLQLLASDSEELGRHKGLGWIDGHVRALEEGAVERVPHVGWSAVHVAREHPLFGSVETQDCFYFDHSFHLECDDDWVLVNCRYGRDIVAAVQRDNVMAVQFHPEKSQRAGLKLLRRYLDLCEGDDGGRLAGGAPAAAAVR